MATEGISFDEAGLPVSYRVDMDMGWFRDVYMAQNRRYFRKQGVFIAVFCLPMAAFMGWALIDTHDLEFALGVLLFGALGALGVAMVMGRGILMRTRQGELSGFFSAHGMAELRGPWGLEDLRCSYGVELSRDGYQVTVERPCGLTVVARHPWFDLRGEVVRTDGGAVLPADDGRNSSLLYNMLGDNAMLREGLERYPLVIPVSTLAAHPGLDAWAGSRVREARSARRGPDAGTGAGYEVRFADGRVADLDDEDDMREVKRLLESEGRGSRS